MQGSGNLGAAAPYIETFGVAKGAAAKVFSLIDKVPLINSLSEEGVCPSELKGIITFKDVHFEYPSRSDVKVLKGFNLTINEGEKVAFVGSSGCGKSTCVHLIQRFYDPQQGQILLDGMDIKYLNVAWLRRQIGVVGQEPVLFQMSIEENIKLGHEDATRRDIIEASGVANALDFIAKLPESYDTLVGERGAQLSGGQKQRIAIARALVRKPHILLLDEATSALDTSSEAKVQAALDKASEGRTTIIVAHRLSTIRGADRIVTINDGKVAEQGTHEELIALKGHYYKLVMAQVNSGEESWAMDISKNTDKGRSIEDKFVIPDFLQKDKTESSSPEEKIAKELPKSSLLQIMRLNKPEWPYIFIACVCSIVMGAAMPVLAVLFGSLIQVYTITLTGEKLTLRLRRMLFAAMLRQEIVWFDEKANSSGALCARLSGDASQVQGATGQRLSIIIQSIATFLLAVGLAMYYEWRLGLVGLAFSPVIMAAQYYFIVVQSGELLNKREAMEQAIQVAVEAVSNIRTVAGLGREHTFHQKYMKVLETVHLVALRNCHFRALVFGMASSIMFFAYGACMYYGGKLVEQEGIPYSNVFKVSQALILGTASVGSALAFTPNLQKGLVAAMNIFQLLNRNSNIVDPEPLGKDKWTIICVYQVAEGSTDYSKVVFSYPTRRHIHVLQDFSMSVRPGQTIALVGPSGCGKTTCVQLLERFYDPSSGVVMLDGRDISSVPLYSLRTQLGVVSQEPVLFNRTIANNIAYGCNMRDVPMSDIVKAAKQANIHTFIASLPMGYQTYIGEKGVQLSGGQKQRVSIARALIRNPRVLILDEATSALDTESEKILIFHDYNPQVVQEALERAKEGRTCITIAHRLSTVQNADIICVLNNGKVVEQGSHSQLLEQKGVYHKLYSLQLGQS
uniref:ABC-type xenobiotic transporter n=1 Tax=Timema cristinae TaxID=61476 RepID=A0A7R9CWH4_TIMCR|nr:unnamed protein product [Timema cristinae]